MSEQRFDLENDCEIILHDEQVRIVGDLIHFDQLTPLENALMTIDAAIESLQTVTLDVSKCEDCISFLLKPIMNWLRGLPSAHARIIVVVREDDGDVIPWHQTVTQTLKDFNDGHAVIDVQHVSN